MPVRSLSAVRTGSTDVWEVERPSGSIHRFSLFANGLIPLDESKVPGDTGRIWLGLQPWFNRDSLPVERVALSQSDREVFWTANFSGWLTAAVTPRHALFGGIRFWTSYEIDNWVSSDMDMELLRDGGPALLFAGAQYDLPGRSAGWRFQLRGFISGSGEEDIDYSPALSASFSLFFPGSEDGPGGEPPQPAAPSEPPPDDLRDD